MAAVKKEVLLPQEVRMYIREHELDKTINSILNDVLKKRPEDPVGYMAERLAESCTSAPAFEALRPLPRQGDGAGEQLRFDVVVFSRGVRARIHTLALGEGALFQSGDPADAGRPVDKRKSGDPVDKKKSGDPADEEPGARAALEAFLVSFFEGAFGEVSVDDVLAFHGRCAGLDKAPPLRAGQVVDQARAEAALADKLLVAAARSLDATPLEVLQRALAAEWRRLAVEQGNRGLAELEVPYPLRSRDDLPAWRELWPKLALPMLHGGSPGSLRAASLRVCVELTPFTAEGHAAERGEDHPEACPPLGWFAATIRALQAARKEAAKMLQADKASASCVVGDVAFAPPGGLLQAAQLAKRAAEAAVGTEDPVGIAGVLLAAGEEAWLREEGVYEVEAGKKLTLEQLVDLYSELAEESFVRTIVQPFRQEDAAAGCELLLARRPDLVLECDYGPGEATPRAPPKGAAFGCVLHLGGTSASRALQTYTRLAPQWQDAGHGCGRCALVDGEPPLSVLDVALACRSRVLCFTSEVADEAATAISAGADEAICRLLFDDGPAGEAA